MKTLWRQKPYSTQVHSFEVDASATTDMLRGVRELSGFPHVTYSIAYFSDSYGNTCERRTEKPLGQSQLIASTIRGTRDHTVMLDLDVPAKLIPSSTEGHSHLYIDVCMSWRKYKRLLRALAKAGVIERGYYAASVRRRHTALRLPWVKKGATQ